MRRQPLTSITKWSWTNLQAFLRLWRFNRVREGQINPISNISYPFSILIRRANHKLKWPLNNEQVHDSGKGNHSNQLLLLLGFIKDPLVETKLPLDALRSTRYRKWAVTRCQLQIDLSVDVLILSLSRLISRLPLTVKLASRVAGRKCQRFWTCPF